MTLNLCDITSDDLLLIEQWLRADHVRSTWGDPGASLRLLNEPPAPGLANASYRPGRGLRLPRSDLAVEPAAVSLAATSPVGERRGSLPGR